MLPSFTAARGKNVSLQGQEFTLLSVRLPDQRSSLLRLDQSKNEREAKEVEKAKRAEAARLVNDSITTGRKPMTIEVACDRWWEQVGKHGSDPDIERALGWLVEQIGPQVALHDINDDMVSRAVEARRKCVMRAGRDSEGTQLYRPISNRTVNKTVPSLLRRVMRKARKVWSVTILNEPNWQEHFLPVPKRPVREITAEEDAVLDEVESIEYAQLREFAEIMGLRRKEMLLTWPQVDFKEKIVRIIGKGGVPAILPLTQRAYEILWWLRGNDKLHVFTFVAQRTRRCPKTGREFVKGQRYPMTYYGIGTNRRRKWKKAGVDARLHDTRHTTGQRGLRATGNLKFVQTLLRHSEIRTTATFYTDTTMADLRAGMERTESQKKSQTRSEELTNTMKNKA
jgi:integrase